jgi:transcriptional regulator with XRE-family HTH domain
MSVVPDSPLSEAIDQSIVRYRLGEKLRRLRLRRKISLVELGKQTGLSPSMLSQLENGKLIPTLPTLTRIAMVFGEGLDFFFTSEDRVRSFFIVRARERQRFAENAEVKDPSVFFQQLVFSARQGAFQPNVAEFPASPVHSGSHFHQGNEFLYLISGRLEIRTATEMHVLEAGDACYFDCSSAHSYRCASGGKATAIVVTAHSPSEY